MAETTGAMHCAYCGRPAAALLWINGLGYHEECTRGPGYQQPTYTPMDPNPWLQRPLPTLTESDIRRIVREELARAGGGNG